jgi:phosphoribosylformylglycinamidine synthase PurS subunit
MSIEVDVTIKLKRGVADPEGENTKKALHLLGFNDVRGVKSMKTFRITLEPETETETETARADEEEETVKREVDEMCRKLLANPVIHDYDIQVVQRDE